jgi:hypothetical protein
MAGSGLKVPFVWLKFTSDVDAILNKIETGSKTLEEYISIYQNLKIC